MDPNNRMLARERPRRSCLATVPDARNFLGCLPARDPRRSCLAIELDARNFSDACPRETLAAVALPLCLMPEHSMCQMPDPIVGSQFGTLAPH